jgi:hypothetical protein
MKRVLFLLPLTLLTMEPVLAAKPFFENRVQALHAKNIGLIEDKVPWTFGRADLTESELLHLAMEEGVNKCWRRGRGDLINVVYVSCCMCE